MYNIILCIIQFSIMNIESSSMLRFIHFSIGSFNVHVYNTYFVKANVCLNELLETEAKMQDKEDSFRSFTPLAFMAYLL